MRENASSRIVSSRSDRFRWEATVKSHAEYVELMYDMMLLAFQTGQTRVASLRMIKEASMRTFPTVNVDEAFHPLSHHGEDPRALVAATLVVCDKARRVAGSSAFLLSVAALIVTLHAPVPVQSPAQPPKVESADAVAVSATVLPVEKLAPHVAPQSIPAGRLVIVPLPVVVTRNIRGAKMLRTLSSAACAFSSRQGPCAGCGGAVMPAAVTCSGAYSTRARQ
mgnify:CR=1 FL=1